MGTLPPRKRQKSVQVQLSSNEDSHQLALALFPSSRPPSNVPFTLYCQSAEDGHLQQSQLSGSPAILVAETNDIQYDSAAQQGHSGYAAQYLVGVHNPRTHLLTLHPRPIPVHNVATSVRALADLAPTHSSTQFAQQRALLGTTFGTKKAIRALNAQARNKLDHASFGDATATASLQSLLHASIASSVASLPSSHSIERTANSNRPIPPPNFAALTPADVYTLADVVSDAELAALDLDPLLAATSTSERNALLPFHRSTFITDRIARLLPPPLSGHAATIARPPALSSKDRLHLRLLVYLSYLFAFRAIATKAKRDFALDRTILSDRLNVDLPPPILLDGLLDRYTELQRTNVSLQSTRILTTWTDAKLLAYLAYLFLYLDAWSTDVAIPAADLAIGSKKLGEVFRSLGCVLVPPSEPECHQLVSASKATSLQDARKFKRAVLRVPLDFPKERKKAPKRI